MKVFVSVDIFGEEAIDLLINHNVEYNNLGRKLTRNELLSRLRDINPDAIIAGTEKYDSEEYRL